MTLSQSDINDLRTYFVHKEGDNAIKGHFLPKDNELYNLGRVGQRFNEIYAKKIVVDTIEGGGTTGGNADQVDGFHASQDPTPNAILPLDGAGVFPVQVYPRALLVDGSRPLEMNLVTLDNVKIDQLFLRSHNHSPADGMGVQINHQDLLNKDADDHPQYTQWGDDEVLTGNWKWVPNYGPAYEPYTEGLVVEPDLYQIRSLSNTAFLIGSPTVGKVSVGPADNAMLYHDATETKLTLGTAANLIQISPNHATHRLWIGNANPALAPFQVEDDGTLRAGVAYLGDWEIVTAYIKNAGVELRPEGVLSLGSGLDSAYLSAVDTTYRFWVGNSAPASAPLKITKTGDVYMYNGYITGHVRSMNYASGTMGYSFESSGRAEVNNLVARGRLDAVVFAKSTISAVSGTMIMSESAVLMEPVGVNDIVITVDSINFSRNDIIHLKPDAYREEWMRIVSPGTVNGEGNVEYTVTRDLAGSGKFTFKIGETVVRQGSAAQDQAMYPLAGGNTEAEYGTYQPGGAGGASSGGWLVLDGSSGTGPYFGVVRRLGPVFDQVDDVVRIGNLYGLAALGHASETYGVFIGDAARYLTYDSGAGLTIKARDGATLVNEAGVTTDAFLLAHTTDTPAPAIGQTQLQAKTDGYLYITPYGQSSSRIMTAGVYDTNLNGVVDNADAVGGIGASSTPTANKLFPLAADANFPESVLGKAVLKTGSTMTGALVTASSLTAYNGGDGMVAIGSSNIEIGKTGRGTAGPAFIDFHSSAGSPDYDTRIISSSGNGTAGNGILDIYAAGGLRYQGWQQLSGDGGMTVVIDGGGAAPTVGWKAMIAFPYKAYVHWQDVVADVAGSCSIGFYVFSALPSTYTQIGTATLSSSQSQSAAITTPTTINAGQVLGFYVGSASTLTRVTITLRLVKVP